METNIRNLESQEDYSKDDVMDLIKLEYFEVKEELVEDVCADNGTVVKQEPPDTYEVFCEYEASKLINFKNTEVKAEILDNILCVDDERAVVKQDPINTDEVCSEDDALESKNKDSIDRPSKEKKHNNVCQICSREYSTRKLLLSHICGSNKYVCTICGKILNSVNLLKIHARNGHRSHVDSRCCRICKKRFSSRNSLDRHRREHHPKSKHASKYVCDICKTSFTFRCNLVRHIQRHDGEKTFRCGVCDKSFYTDYRLIDHMLVHTGVREISCEICNKKFARRRALVEHLKHHANKKRFKCDVCNKDFLTKWNMKVHTQKVHGLMIVCGVCKKDFASESDLEKHRVKCTK